MKEFMSNSLLLTFAMLLAVPIIIVGLVVSDLDSPPSPEIIPEQAGQCAADLEAARELVYKYLRERDLAMREAAVIGGICKAISHDLEARIAAFGGL